MLIPDHIEHFESNGERILYFRFKNDGSTRKMYVLHSLFTNYHFNNISGELDFLVIAPNEGIFAIEVKHGHVSRKNGTWNYKNRHGKITKKKLSPFAQVNGTMNSIRNFILDKIKYDKKLYERISKILWGSGVAFTSMNEFVDFGTEAHSFQVLNKSGLVFPIGNFIQTLSSGCHNQSRDKRWYDVNLSRPTETDCEMILKILRGDLDIDYSEINRITDNEYLIEEYTKEQFGLLEFVRHNDRCLIEGFAGSGKTLMAIEITRRNIKKFDRVAVFCFNKRLGNKLEDSISKLTDLDSGSSYVGTLHSYMFQRIENSSEDINKENYFSEILPFKFILENEYLTESEKFDMIVIDEAQDLLTPYYVEVMDLILKGGIREGKWVFFGDFNNQAIYLNNPKECLRFLNSKAIFTNFPPLKVNCRNTKKIADQNTLLTGVERSSFKPELINGDSPVVKFPKVKNQLNVVESILQELVNDRIPMNRITMLSPKKEEHTFLNNNNFIKKLKREGLEISSIQGFKGLENTIIILYDFEELESDEAQRLLYVGISRARQKLFLVLNNTLEKSYQKLLQKNYLKLS